MADFSLWVALADLDGSCARCGHSASWSKGPRIGLGPFHEPICRECARAHAPDLIALADLAHVASKVARNGRHLLTPPMESLLDLSRAAEVFTAATTPPAATRAA